MPNENTGQDVAVEKGKLDELANIIAAKSDNKIPLTLDEMVDAVYDIETNPNPNLQKKTVKPTEKKQTIKADSGYDGLSEVEVKAIDKNYVGTGQVGIYPTITNPQDGDTLVYNATQQKWVNGAGGSGGGLVVTGYNLISGEGTLNKTWQEIYDAASQGKSVVLVDEREIEGITYKAAYTLGAIDINIDNTPVIYTVLFENQLLQCASADDYPTTEYDGDGDGDFS